MAGSIAQSVAHLTAGPRVVRSNPLRKHAYSNILKILPPKNGNFSDKEF